MNRVEGLVLSALLVVVAALALVGRPDRRPSVEAIAEAERVAEAALLTVGDLPGDGWEVAELGMADNQYQPDPSDWPSECGPVWNVTWSHNSLAARGRVFNPQRDPTDLTSGQGTTVGMSVEVFGSAQQLQEALAAQAERSAALSTPECERALEARRAERGSEWQTEEPRYSITDETRNRATYGIRTPSGTTTVTSETHVFTRGRVMAMFNIIGSDEPPREVDYQRLLEAFEARVAAAQE